MRANCEEELKPAIARSESLKPPFIVLADYTKVTFFGDAPTKKLHNVFCPDFLGVLR